MDRNGWTPCAGTAGRLPPEPVDGITGIRILTRNEVAAAKERSDYRVLLVTGVAKGAGEIIELRDPGAWLNEDEMEVMAWAVRDWHAQASVRRSWTRTQ